MYTFDDAWLEKLAALRAGGSDPYPTGFDVSHCAAELHGTFGDVDDPSDAQVDVRLGGRVMFRNRMGRALFLRLHDRTGKIQVYVRRDNVGEDAFAAMKVVDIGDFVWIRGSMMRTRTGELTVLAAEARLASKVMTSFPDRWHGVVDVETRSRQRYVDLLMNEESRTVFRQRSAIVREIRDFFHERDYIEVETPIMQPIPGGANARPFVTHHNALSRDVYLRIAPELYLKRLVVGGLERVFELNRCFRNEGVSVKHNPEFTMLEFYQTWTTYEALMALTEQLFRRLAHAVCGGPEVAFAEHVLDFGAPFRRVAMDAAIAQATGLTLQQLEDPTAMEAHWRAHHTCEDDEPLPTTRGEWWEWLFDESVEPHLIQPTFVTGFPIERSPLSRRSDVDPSRADRFELFVAGWEIANGFSELNDPVDQAQRFEDQVAARDAGDDESMHFDADYVRALTYGLPPTAGEGIGIDRLVMLLTGKTSIREVVLFPAMRHEGPTQ